MPIYAYRCTECGHAEDVLQKMSAAPLTVCPACGQSTYAKQVTAAGFQLKGSGWYVTDFRNNASKQSSGAKTAADTAATTPAAPASSSPSDSSTPSPAKPSTPAAASSSD